MKINQLLQSKIVTWIEKFSKYLSFVSKFQRNIKTLWLEQEKEMCSLQSDHLIHLPTWSRLRSHRG